MHNISCDRRTDLLTKAHSVKDNTNTPNLNFVEIGTNNMRQCVFQETFIRFGFKLHEKILISKHQITITLFSIYILVFFPTMCIYKSESCSNHLYCMNHVYIQHCMNGYLKSMTLCVSTNYCT